MKQPDFLDLGKLMDNVFSAAEDFSNSISQTFPSGKSENRDFYPSYAYPPTNVYITEDKMLIFEFALAGFTQEDVSLEFSGDYMVFSATAPKAYTPPENAQFIKQRLKLKPVEDQKYYVPENKFDHKQVQANLKDGILRITVPPKDEPTTAESVRINING